MLEVDDVGGQAGVDLAVLLLVLLILRADFCLANDQLSQGACVRKVWIGSLRRAVSAVTARGTTVGLECSKTCMADGASSWIL